MSVRPRSAGIIAAIAVLAISLCPRAYAPIYGSYPGLANLISESDMIAAVTIVEQLSEEGFGGSARYKIEFDKVLKGTPPQKQVAVWLRSLEIIPGMDTEEGPQPQPSRHYFAPYERLEPFQKSSRHVVFLAKTKADKEDEGALYENVNCMGSTFPISPLRDLEALKVESLPDTLALLFREYVDFKRTDLKELEQQLQIFIRGGDK